MVGATHWQARDPRRGRPAGPGAGVSLRAERRPGAGHGARTRRVRAPARRWLVGIRRPRPGGWSRSGTRSGPRSLPPPTSPSPTVTQIPPRAWSSRS